MQRGKKIAALVQAFDDQPDFSRLDTAPWYAVNMDRVDLDLKLLYYPSSCDAETYNFLNESSRLSSSFCLQMFYGLCTIFLKPFATKTTINGVLERGRMFVFSSEQLGNFMKIDPNAWNPEYKTVIDLGAGDGYVTKNFKPFFGKIFATEASTVMEYRLSQKGFTTVDKDKWPQKGPYNLISALNLLDRFFDPKKLLNDIHSTALRDNALVLMAIVLPIKQYVEFHPDGRRKTTADNVIHVEGRTFEEHLNSFVRNVVVQNGFEVIRWTKLPYLCEGDANRSFYKLDDCLFLLKAVPMAPGSGGYGTEGPEQSAHTIHEL